MMIRYLPWITIVLLVVGLYWSNKIVNEELIQVKHNMKAQKAYFVDRLGKDVFNAVSIERKTLVESKLNKVDTNGSVSLESTLFYIQ